MKKILGLIMLAMVLVCSYSVAECGSMNRYTSSHFTVYYHTNITTQLETFYRRISKDMGSSISGRMVVRIYPTKGEFVKAGHSDRVRGLAWPSSKKIVTYYHGNLMGTLNHEIAHILEYHKTGDTGEGLARYYEDQYQSRADKRKVLREANRGKMPYISNGRISTPRNNYTPKKMFSGFKGFSGFSHGR